MSQFEIINNDNDFLQVQNYVLQLVAEGKITASAYVLYSFYKSLAGFKEIRCGYEYISLNTGLAKGNISKCNKLLIENELIQLYQKSRNHPFQILIRKGSDLPKRQLKSPEYDNDKHVEYSGCSPREHQSSPDEHQSSRGEPIYIDNIYNTTTGKEKFTPEEEEFLLEFIKTWKYNTNSKRYPKKDFKKIKQIKNLKEARKLIPVLWIMDDFDNWVKTSDHSITIFMKEYNSGRLQSIYPNTKHYYMDKNI